MNILHITNWYPSTFFPKEGIWIKRQIDALGLNPGIINTIYHVEIFKGPFKFKIEQLQPNGRHYLLWLPFEIWKVNEILYNLFLTYILFIRERKKTIDVLNIHIAYPLLTYYHIFKRWVKPPILINEHWSAYHNNFGINKKNKTAKIRRIFCQGIPVCSVSESLGNDIRRFSGNAEYKAYKIPNIVEEEFKWIEYLPVKDEFFMLSQWKSPKEPIPLLEAFIKLENKFKLIIGGYGPLEKQMRDFVKAHHLEKRVIFRGTMETAQIVEQLNKSIAFLHSSDYETFSVVCAEAICCGTPVIASAVGGIPEFIKEGENGILISENTYIEFEKGISLILDKQLQFDRKKISERSCAMFNRHLIGSRYLEVMKKVSHKQ